MKKLLLALLLFCVLPLTVFAQTSQDWIYLGHFASADGQHSHEVYLLPAPPSMNGGGYVFGLMKAVNDKNGEIVAAVYGVRCGAHVYMESLVYKDAQGHLRHAAPTGPFPIPQGKTMLSFLYNVLCFMNE